MRQLELFFYTVDGDLEKAIIYLRKKIRSCEKDIYRLEKKILRDSQHLHHTVMVNDDGSVNFIAEKVRRKLIKAYFLREEALKHLYKSYNGYKKHLVLMYKYLNLNMILISK